jgi:uncharacterized repeat protein (TIGR01451 family)
MWRSWTTWRLAILAVAIGVAAASGCSSLPSSGIDPSGEHFFAPPSPPAQPTTAAPAPAPAPASNERYFDEPMGQAPWDGVELLLRPREIVVPVGGEVVLVAGVAASDGYLRTNRRLEWSIAPGSVGQFVDIEKGGFTDLLVGDFTWPRKVTNIYAVGSTSRSNVRINRGLPNPENDVFVRRGESWITVTSPIEGTTNVVLTSPDVYRWDARTKTAAIHWVDASVQYPAPAVNPAGTRHVFTTTVTRPSNGSPCENWPVRYEILSGPPAVFSQSGSKVAEVRTNAAGQAGVEIVQQQPTHGQNQISIRVMRPGNLPGAGGQPLMIGRGGMTSKTWTAADLAVRATAPATVGVGGAVTCRIDVSNPGDQAAKDVTAALEVPDGLTYLGANPQAEQVGRRLRWRLGDLGGLQQRAIAVQFRAERLGAATLSCNASATGGLRGNHSATTTVVAAGAPLPTASPLEVQTACSVATARVGDKVTFNLTVGNRGTTPLTRVRIKVYLDPGLEHPEAKDKGAVERTLDLAAGESRPFKLVVLVTRPGRLYQTIEVSEPGGARASAQAFVTVVDSAVAPPPTRPATPPFSVTISGPPAPVTVGSMAEFVILVTNTGDVSPQNLRVVASGDPCLAEPINATRGFKNRDGILTCNIERLLAGQTEKLRIQYTCVAAAAKAVCRVSVCLPDGKPTEVAAAVEIRQPAPPPLSADGLALSVVSLSNPVKVGRDLTYEIRVTNRATASYRQIGVAAIVPQGMTPVELGTTPTSAKFGSQSVQFDPVSELRPGESLTYGVRVHTKSVGRYVLSVRLTTAELPQPKMGDAAEIEVGE